MSEKLEWDSSLSFIFAMIGAAVGLGNIWRFSYVLYSNGGGSFFIPYFTAIAIMGIPFLILEYGVGFSFKESFSKILRKINTKFEKEIIPERLLPVVTENELLWEMAPSAELKDNQYDPMKWFYHDWLISKLTDSKCNVEDIMESYLDGSLLQSEVGRWIKHYHLDEPKAFIDDLEWVSQTISEYNYYNNTNISCFQRREN